MKIILSAQRRVLKLAVKMCETKCTVFFLDPWGSSEQNFEAVALTGQEPLLFPFPRQCPIRQLVVFFEKKSCRWILQSHGKLVWKIMGCTMNRAGANPEQADKHTNKQTHTQRNSLSALYKRPTVLLGIVREISWP